MSRDVPAIQSIKESIKIGFVVTVFTTVANAIALMQNQKIRFF